MQSQLVFAVESQKQVLYRYRDKLRHSVSDHVSVSILVEIQVEMLADGLEKLVHHCESSGVQGSEKVRKEVMKMPISVTEARI